MQRPTSPAAPGLMGSTRRLECRTSSCLVGRVGGDGRRGGCVDRRSFLDKRVLDRFDGGAKHHNFRLLVVHLVHLLSSWIFSLLKPASSVRVERMAELL